MKVLVLEDNPARISFFQSACKGDELHIATTMDGFADAVSSEVFDKMFLDHDLGGLTFVSSDSENSGYQAVKYMVEHGLQRNADIIVHSCNPAGAQNMVSLLQSMDYKVRAAPFMLGGLLQSMLA